MPTREWEGVFDAWIQGDAQQFAEILRAEIEKEAKAKEVAIEKKRRKDEEAAMALASDEMPDLARMREQGKIPSARMTTSNCPCFETESNHSPADVDQEEEIRPHPSPLTSADTTPHVKEGHKSTKLSEGQRRRRADA